jgi:hypothetical protein
MAQGIAKEAPEVRTVRVLAVAGATLLFLIAVAFGFELIFKDRIGQTATTQSSFPLPGVVPNEAAMRLELEAKQRAALGGAGGRIPIDQAMDAIVARGPRAFEPIEAGP